MTIDAATRRAINETQVRNFFAAWDPAWRWVLTVGLRDLRANVHRLGKLAAAEMDNESWEADSYVYGPLSLGITAAAVNEAAQHCEDLFALLTFVRDPLDFAKRMASYGAGKVTSLGKGLLDESDDDLRKRYMVPEAAIVEDGMSKAENPAQAVANVESAVGRLTALTRKIADWYLTYEFFHLQYKHGFKLPLRPFSGGALPPETVEKRKHDVSAPLIAFTNENVSAMLARPPSQQGLMMLLTPETQPHLNELIADRALLRYQMSGPEVNLDDVVDISRTIFRLLRILQQNRISLSEGPDDHGQQIFSLPGAAMKETVEARLEPSRPIVLDDFH